ncbi:hypothetical protein ACVBEQ_09085 [Nakamurella sp. GG22]
MNASDDDDRPVRMFDYWSLVSNLDEDRVLSLAIAIVLQQHDVAGRASMIRLLGLAEPRIDVSTPPEPPQPGTPDFGEWLARPHEGPRIRAVRYDLGILDAATIFILATLQPADPARLFAVRQRLGSIADGDLTVACGIARQMIETGSERAPAGAVPEGAALDRLIAAGILATDGDGLVFS